MSEFRQIEFPDKDLPLRQDVSLLGQLLGETLVQQHGPGLLQHVEDVRRAAILMREGDESCVELLESTLACRTTEEITHLIKSFSAYLRLANLAEKVHRIRRRRAYLKQGEVSQRGSISQVIASLVRSGVGAEAIEAALEKLRICPVFTAHPTEATRRSLLEKEYSIIHRLVERLNPDLTAQEEQQALERIRDAISSSWQTSPVPSAKPQVSDELDNVLFYLTDIIYRVAPPFQEAVQNAMVEEFGAETRRPDISRLLRFGSWVGGDMDGNPNVTGRTLLESLDTQRNAIIRCYQPEVLRLSRYLSQTRPQIGFHLGVVQRLKEYEQRMPHVRNSIPARHRDMLYRCLLTYVSARLEATRRNSADSYAQVEEFQSDIDLISTSLEQNRGRHAGLFGVRRLQQRIATFGFHLATLDTRQDAQVHRCVIGELLDEANWEDWDSAARSQRLSSELDAASAASLASRSQWSPQTESTLGVFRAIGEARKRFGAGASGLFIVSMTQGADDVLSVLFLAAAAGLGGEDGVQLDVAPLLETVDDLRAGPEILEELLSLGPYREHLERRGNRQVIMVGYSDSNKDSGIVSARWSLHQAQRVLADTGRRHGVCVQFFHGRGGTVSRGGGNLVKGIEGAPPGTIDGYFRVTEQGETINQKYGVRPIALRNLELMTGAVLRHGLGDTGQKDNQVMRELMTGMASAARRKYRKLVFETPGFVDFFRKATPIDVIERLEIGSRPSSRRSGRGIENLRAIPWVFSWAQVRIGFPGVFGIGTALAGAVEQEGIDRLRNLLTRWTFFQGLVNDAEMVLAKSVLDIGERYAALAGPEGQAVFTQIRDEFEMARHSILAIKQTSELLEDQRTLQRNIRLRNPYVDPIHILQIDLLRRWRKTERRDDDLLHLLKSTVHGIALAVQNTG